MKGLDAHVNDMDSHQANSAVTSTHTREWNQNSACNSEVFRLKECSKLIGKRTVCCRRNDSYRSFNISQRCRYKNSETCYSLFYTCLVGTILFTLWSECSARTTRNRTPLIITDESHGEGFRYFLRHADNFQEEITSRSVAPGLTYAPKGLAFQTFKFIKRWGNETDILLLGGQDHVYMLDGKFADSSGEIAYRERLTWRTQTRPRNECIMMPGQPGELCENFIRFIELMENGELMVCGTNAYSPACRYYKREQFDERIYGEDSDYRDEKKCRGQCVVPHNPTTASVSLYTNTNNGYQIFAAAINGFMANDPIIMKKYPTLLSNSLWLNEPTFLKIMEYGDKVYVFFRETAKEPESGTKEKVTYARVAQMCKNDPGGINVLAHHWTSFLKARLSCGYSERQHLQFDNLTSVSDIVRVSGDTEDDVDIFYATFTTPWDWTESSVSTVCAFSMAEVAKVFEQGRFLGEETFELRPQSRPQTTLLARPSLETISKVTKSFPIEEDLIPTPRPGSCNLVHSPQALYFAKVHPLMYDGVLPLFFTPIYVIHDLRATQIAVDNNAGGSGKQMLYIGTEDGKVLRLRSMLPTGKHPKAVLIESISVEKEEKCLEQDCNIRSLHISRPIENNVEQKPSLFVAFTDHVVQLPLGRCNVYRTKECCSVDPDCGWNRNECVLRTSHNSERLLPTSRDTDPLPEVCSTTSLNERCDCKSKRSEGCNIENDEEDAFDIKPEPDLNSLLEISLSSEIRRQYLETVNGLSGVDQQNLLITQLAEAISSTVGLVLRNHKQEYCLPSLAVNHLTHVYPLLIREIELWHETALKKMIDSDIDPKCWTTNKKCPQRVSFSLPLVPMLWEPLSKLITNFSGKCRAFDERTHAAAFRPRPRSQCEPLPGLEPCKDTRHPHCRPERCQFSEYAVDVKAFFRHANDSRPFLKNGDAEPLWKSVNVTLPSGESVTGRLKLVVSDDEPFMIDYSPIAEKVKIMFHYKPVKDCADRTDPTCVGTLQGCDREVENVIDHWFKWVMRKMPHRLRKCVKEIKRARKRDSRMRDARHGYVGRPRDPAIQEGQGEWNRINVRKEKCRRVVGKVQEFTSQPLTKNIWSEIVIRSQRAGGVHFTNSANEGKIEFFSLTDVLHFFHNMCTFEVPSEQRSTLSRRVRRTRLIHPMVTTDTPFIIERNDRRITIKYFVTDR